MGGHFLQLCIFIHFDFTYLFLWLVLVLSNCSFLMLNVIFQYSPLLWIIVSLRSRVIEVRKKVAYIHCFQCYYTWQKNLGVRFYYSDNIYWVTTLKKITAKQTRKNKSKQSHLPPQKNNDNNNEKNYRNIWTFLTGFPLFFDNFLGHLREFRSVSHSF